MLAPRLLDHRRYNPMLTIMVMLALTDVLGILGLLLAVPLAAVIQIVLSEFSTPSAVTVAASQPQSAPAGAPGGEHGRRADAAVRAADGRLSPIQLNMVERLRQLNDEARNMLQSQ